MEKSVDQRIKLLRNYLNLTFNQFFNLIQITLNVILIIHH